MSQSTTRAGFSVQLERAAVLNTDSIKVMYLVSFPA